MRFLTGIMVLGCATLTYAAPPPLLNVQGVLTGSSGLPPADGEQAVKFSLWNAPVAGLNLWTELDEVETASGTFSAIVGDTSPLPIANDVLASEAELWMEIEVIGSLPLPRQRVVSVLLSLYAMRAETADEAEHAAVADQAHDLACSGCVAATELAAGALDLAGHEVLNLVIHNAAAGAPPASPSAGQLWFNTTKTRLMVYDGAEWTDVATGDTGGALPPDGLAAVSNGLLTNQFFDTFASTTTPHAIPDQNPNGVLDSITVEDVGVAQKLTVSIDVSNSNIEDITVTLTDPNGATYTLYDEGSTGGSLVTTYPDPTATVSGDLTAWHGQNPKGIWTLQIVDHAFFNNTVDGAINAWSIKIQTLSSKKVQATGNLLLAGSLTFADGSSLSSVKDAMPSGAVLTFDLAACPPGWSGFGPAEGRVIVGMPSGGALGATVGSPLADQGARVITSVPAHSHGVDPPSVSSTTNGGHTHCLNVSGADDNNHTGNFDGVADSDAGNKGCIRNTSAAGDHTHSVDIGGFESASTGMASVDVTMPYVQLLVCRKN